MKTTVLPVGMHVSFYVDIDALHFRPFGYVRCGKIVEILSTDDRVGPHYKVRLDDGRVQTAYLGELRAELPPTEERE